jgi:hypothetical protein
MAKKTGVASSNKMMPTMQTYGGQESAGYKPPSGSAGRAAYGDYGHKSNPLKVPMKGSQIGAGYGNADRQKAMRNKDEQLRKENLRGQAC